MQAGRKAQKDGKKGKKSMGLESVWNEKKRWKPYAIRVSAYPLESVWNIWGKKRTLKKVFDPTKARKK